MGDVCKACEGKGIVVKDGVTWTCDDCSGLGRIMRHEVLRPDN